MCTNILLTGFPYTLKSRLTKNVIMAVMNQDYPVIRKHNNVNTVSSTTILTHKQFNNVCNKPRLSSDKAKKKCVFPVT